jgi:hypothetical protein
MVSAGKESLRTLPLLMQLTRENWDFGWELKAMGLNSHSFSMMMLVSMHKAIPGNIFTFESLQLAGLHSTLLLLLLLLWWWWMLYSIIANFVMVAC